MRGHRHERRHVSNLIYMSDVCLRARSTPDIRMPNRVEELELRVSELESTVDGLTDELVQTKERVRLLEEHIDGDVPAIDEELAAPSAPPSEEAEPEAVEEATAEADKSGEPDTTDETPDESETSDDIIIA